MASARARRVSCLVVILTAAMAANENTDCSLSRRREHAQALGTILVLYILEPVTLLEHEVGVISSLYESLIQNAYP